MNILPKSISDFKCPFPFNCIKLKTLLQTTRTATCFDKYDTTPVYYWDIHSIIRKFIIFQQVAWRYYQAKSPLCPVSHIESKSIQWQTKVVQLQKLSVVLLHTLLKGSNILMLCTDFVISSLSLSEMHQVSVLYTHLSTSTVGYFCNSTKNNINRLSTAVVSFYLLVSHTITFLFIFWKVYLATQAFFLFYEYFFWPSTRLNYFAI